MDWITEIYSQVMSIVQYAGGSLNELVENIDGVQFGSGNVLYQFLGMVRYVVGDNLYTLLCILINIGLLLTIYRLIIIVIDIVSNLIPGLKGRIVIR